MRQNIHRYSLVIRERHLDTLGHVNNATYLELFEEARWQLITENGYSLETMRQEKKGPVILEINLQFKQELTLRQEICIETELLEYPGKVGKLQQRMLSEKGLHAEATFTFGLFDLQLRRLIPATDKWRKAIGLESHGARSDLALHPEGNPGN